MLISIILSSLLPTLASISSPQEISNNLLSTGQRAYAVGYYQQALEKFNEAIERNPNNHIAYSYRAATKLALGDIESSYNDILIAEEHLEKDFFLANTKAQILQNKYESLSIEEINELETLLDELIAYDPDNVDIRLWRGSYNFNKKEFQKTIDDLEQFTSNTEALLFTGTSYFELGNYHKSLESLEKANHLSPNNISVLQQLVVAHFTLENYEQALVSQQNLIALSEPDPVLYKDQGMMYILIDELTLAIESYKKANTYLPNDEEILFQLGVLSFQTENYQEAIDYFSKSISQNNEWGDAYMNRATSYIALEEYENAYQDYLSAYQLFPKSLELLQKITELELLLGYVENSIQNYSALIEIDPTNIENLFTHAYLVTTYQIDKCLDVAWELEKIIELDESQTIPYHYLGLCAYSKDLKIDAYDYWEKALDGLPETLDSLYFLAYLDYQEESYQQSLERVDQLIELDSTYYIGYFLRGNIYLELEQYEQSINDYQIAIEQDINLIISHFNQSVAYFNLDQLSLAEQGFLTAIEIAKEQNETEFISSIQSALNTLYEHPDWQNEEENN